MKRNILAICDLEVAYASHFMEHMNLRKNIPFEVQAFSCVTQLKHFTKQQSIEILLISENAWEPEVTQLSIGQIIVLAEGTSTKSTYSYPSVSKYQSSDSVIREVMAVYAAESRDREVRPVNVTKRDMKIIGVYSPVGRCMKTSFALTLGRLLSRDRPTLYINLESYAGFEQLFGKSYDRTLSDIIYYMRKEKDNLINRLHGAIQTLDNLDYIPPVPFPQDIADIRFEEWNWLLETLRGESSYQRIVLDIGDSVEDICPLLEKCDYIFLPEKNDFISQAKISQFESLMDVWNGQKVLDRIEKIKLPYYTAQGTGEQFLQQLIWSQFGDYTRNIIKESGL